MAGSAKHEWQACRHSPCHTIAANSFSVHYSHVHCWMYGLSVYTVSIGSFICLLTPAEDFRGRCSNDRAVLELFEKASKELECVMEGESACMLVWCRCVLGLVY